MTNNDGLTDNLKAHYGAAARRAATGAPVIEHHCGNANDACGPVGKDSTETFGAGLYEAAELAELPAEAVAGSIGCANPVALARLERGEDILDLGPAEASMCCSRLAEWDPRAAPMGWT